MGPAATKASSNVSEQNMHDAAARALAAAGERFMQLFDDHDEKPSTSQPATPSRRTKKLHSSGSGGSRAHAAHGQHAAAKQTQSMQGPGPQALSNHAGGALQPAGRVHKHFAAKGDDIEEILREASAAKRRRTEEQGQATAGGAAVQVVEFGRSTGRGGAAAAGPSSADVKAERRAFMSHKASKVHSGPSLQGGASSLLGGAGPQELDPTLSAEEFKQLQLQVEKLGGSALDSKRQRKQWKAQFLERLGVRPEKAPQMSAKIGMGIARKREERERKALAEAIASGVVRVKGMGKKKRALKDKERDRGLLEAPSFKNGVLKIKKPQEPKPSGGVDSGGPMGRGRGPKAGKGGFKGKGRPKGGKGGSKKKGKR